MDYVAVGRRIRAQRKKLSLSQEELAEMVNISTVHMSHIETGYTKLSLPVLVDLACALGVRTVSRFIATYSFTGFVHIAQFPAGSIQPPAGN